MKGARQEPKQLRTCACFSPPHFRASQEFEFILDWSRACRNKILASLSVFLRVPVGTPCASPGTPHEPKESILGGWSATLPLPDYVRFARDPGTICDHEADRARCRGRC